MIPVREKPGYLIVVCSSNQLYSGTGTALFEWILYAKEHFRFGFLMDCEDKRNFDIGRKFCAENGVEFFTEIPSRKRGAGDPGVARIAHYLRSGSWPYVEIVSWANAATNIDVATGLPPSSKLIFTPHNQPLWTIPNGDDHFLIAPVLRLCLERADLVCCDSPAEVAKLQEIVSDVRAHFLPIGVDDTKFTLAPNAQGRKQLLMVCDCVEHRKRVGLAVAAAARVMKEHDLNFVMVGRGSDKVIVPENIEDRITRLGYVSESELVSLYQDSAVFLLLSDYEAFGIPIAEALFCGVEAVINDTPEMRSIFQALPGIHLVDNRNEAVVDAAIMAALQGTAKREAINEAATAKFSSTNAFQKKLDAIKAIGGRRDLTEEQLFGWDIAL